MFLKVWEWRLWSQTLLLLPFHPPGWAIVFKNITMDKQLTLKLTLQGCLLSCFSRYFFGLFLHPTLPPVNRLHTTSTSSLAWKSCWHILCLMSHPKFSWRLIEKDTWQKWLLKALKTQKCLAGPQNKQRKQTTKEKYWTNPPSLSLPTPFTE